MKRGKTFVEWIAFAAAVAFSSFGAAGAEGVVNASSFGWNAADSTAALQAALTEASAGALQLQKGGQIYKDFPAEKN